MREENMKGCLDGICTACNKGVKVDFREEWHLDRKYKVGECSACGYEHSVLIENITPKVNWVKEDYPN